MFNRPRNLPVCAVYSGTLCMLLLATYFKYGMVPSLARD